MDATLLIAAVYVASAVVWWWSLRTAKEDEEPMQTTYDGTAVRLYVFKRGTKVMRIYANDLDDAHREVKKWNFNPPYESVTIPAGQDVDCGHE